MLRLIFYFLAAFCIVFFFGLESGLVTIENPKKIKYERDKVWSAED
jgi:hypothetical protein